MRNFTPSIYQKVTEENPDPILKEHMHAELEVIENIKEKDQKTFVDLGSGHGRLLPYLSKWGRKVLAIEISEAMLSGLTNKASNLNNVKILKGDITRLKDTLKNYQADLNKAVLLLVQNTLGTIDGSFRDVLDQMKEVVLEHKGELIISLFRARALKDWGVRLYTHNRELCGDIDYEETDFDRGYFVSKTGYTSQWWCDDAIKEIKTNLGGEIIDEVWTDNYYILHMSFD